MSACSCFALLFSLIAAAITGVILYFILKYKPSIENAVDIIDNIDSDTIKQISDLVDQISDSKIANNISDLNNTIQKVDDVVTQLDTGKVTEAISTIQDVVTQLDTDEVTNAISTIEDVADQLNKMMAGEDIEKTSLGKAIERYACTNLIPDSYEAKIWDGWNINNSVSSYLPTIQPITYNFDIRDQVDACKKYN